MNSNKQSSVDTRLISDNLKFDKLKNHLIIKGRIGWKGLKKSEYQKSGYAIINGENMVDGSIDWTSCGRVSKKRFEESPEIMLKQGDILMTKDGTIGKLAYIDNLPEPATVASGVFVIRNNSDILNQIYLYYYLQSNFFKKIIETRKEGSVVPHLYQRDLIELEIPIPQIREQLTFVKILLSLDNKIKENKKTQIILEQIIHVIFKHWLIDFEFPNEKGKPYKSSGGRMIDSEIGEIPEGWKIEKLQNICSINMGQSPNSEFYNKKGNGLPFHQGITNFGYRFPTHKIYCSKLLKIANEGDILFSVRAPVGRINLTMDKIVIGRGLSSIRHKNNYQSFLFYSLKNKFYKDDIIGSGTVFAAIAKKDIENIKIVLPTDNIINIFERLASVIDKFIEHNYKQTEILINLHDLLLHKLLSGEIRIKKN